MADNDGIKDQILKVRLDIFELINREDYKKPNILLLGKSGSGKSALINTVIKAICGSYYQRAKPGSGVAQSKTLELTYFENCGVLPQDIQKSDDEDNKSLLIPNLPNMFDCAAMGNTDTPEGQELLTLLLAGRIPPGTDIQELENCQKEFGVGYLKRTAMAPCKEWRISKIVYVQSGQDAAAVDLIKSIIAVTSAPEPKVTGDIFTVVTKYDSVVDRPHALQNLWEMLPGRKRHTAQEEETIIFRDDYEAVIADVAKQLSIIGHLEDNLERWSSYCDGRYDDPQTDLRTLKFMQKLVLPGTPEPPPIPPQPWRKHVFNWLYKIAMHYRNNLPGLFLQVALVLLLVAIIIAMYM